MAVARRQTPPPDSRLGAGRGARVVPPGDARHVGEGARAEGEGAAGSRAERVSAWRGARRAIRRARLGTHLSARQWQIVSTARKLPVGTT